LQEGEGQNVLDQAAGEAKAAGSDEGDFRHGLCSLAGDRRLRRCGRAGIRRWAQDNTSRRIVPVVQGAGEEFGARRARMKEKGCGMRACVFGMGFSL